MPVTSSQAEILKLLQELWAKYPNNRFGELIENHLIDCTNGKIKCIFLIEDKEWLTRFQRAMNTEILKEKLTKQSKEKN